MDISMPDLDGITATRKLITAVPDAKVLALSAHAERVYVVHMLEAGARGYVVKTHDISQMVEAIRAVSEGRVYLCDEAARAVARPDAKPSALRQREADVVALLALGKTSAQIGKKLDIPAATVDVYRRNIMRKLNVHNDLELTQYAIREGLIQM
jgi:DNA-binding NarL/FixJ family response regulator